MASIKSKDTTKPKSERREFLLLAARTLGIFPKAESSQTAKFKKF